MSTRQRWGRRIALAAGAVALTLAAGVPAALALDIEGVTVGGKALITSPGAVLPQAVNTSVVLKLRLRVVTRGFGLLLCKGSFADFQAGNCSIGVNALVAAQGRQTGQFSDGFAVIDNTQFYGELLYVINNTAGAQTAPVEFIVTIE
jgi:hypothetical protein